MMLSGTSRLALLAQEEAARELSPIEQILGNPLVPIVGLFFLYYFLSLIHISEPTRQPATSRMPSSA